MCSNNKAGKATAALVAVRYRYLVDKHNCEDTSLDELLDKAGILYSTYFLGLKVCSKGNSVENKFQRNVMVGKSETNSGVLDLPSSTIMKLVLKRLPTDSCHCLSSSLAER